MRWIALSDSRLNDGGLAPDRAGGLLAAGALVIELSLPLMRTGVLLDYQANEGWSRTLSLFHDATTDSLCLLHRQGDRLTRHVLRAPQAGDAQTARLIYAWDAPARIWTLRLETRGQTPDAVARGVNPMPLPMADVAALCSGLGVAHRDGSVLWFGVTDRDAPPASAPWFGLRTPVPTTAGPIPAGLLRPGAEVITRDGPRALHSLRRMNLPARGLFAPVMLRAPYFTRITDLLVSSEQMIAIGGLEVEYLFGEDEVLVEAGCLIDGRAALPDPRRATVACVSLDLGGPALLEIDGCTLMSAHHGDSPPRAPLRVLHGYEALPLMALLRRLRPADAA